MNNRRWRLLPGTFTNSVLSTCCVPDPVLGTVSNEKQTSSLPLGGLGPKMCPRGMFSGLELLAQLRVASYFILHLPPEETEAQGAQEPGLHSRSQDLS